YLVARNAGGLTTPWHLVGRHSKLGIGRVVARKGLTVNTVDQSTM
ncbi:unnamed protein product, partial [Arabidopsis halleri]